MVAMNDLLKISFPAMLVVHSKLVTLPSFSSEEVKKIYSSYGLVSTPFAKHFVSQRA